MTNNTNQPTAHTPKEAKQPNCSYCGATPAVEKVKVMLLTLHRCQKCKDAAKKGRA